MKTQLLNPEILEKETDNSLTSLINTLSGRFELPAIPNRSLVINDIPDNISIDADEELLSAVLSGILTKVIRNTENGSIRITAKKYNNVVLLHIKNDGVLHYDSIVHSLPVLQAQAEKLGGFIGFTSFRNRISTIAFSFTNGRNIS